MQDFTELDITIMLDDNGNYIADITSGDPLQVWIDNHGDSIPANLATYQIKLKVPTPKPIVVTGELPATTDKPLTLTLS